MEVYMLIVPHVAMFNATQPSIGKSTGLASPETPCRHTCGTGQHCRRDVVQMFTKQSISTYSPDRQRAMPIRSTPPRASSASSGSGGSCHCLSIISSLHEALIIDTICTNLQSIPITLRLNKHLLKRMKEVLDCIHCSGISHIKMQLIVLCQENMTSYEQSVALLTKQFNKLHRSEQEVTREIGTHKDQEQGSKMILGEYNIDVEEEPCIFGGVLTLQLGVMVAFVTKLKKKLQDGNLDNHLGVLEAVEKRVNELSRICTSPCEVQY